MKEKKYNKIAFFYVLVVMILAAIVMFKCFFSERFDFRIMLCSLGVLIELVCVPIFIFGLKKNDTSLRYKISMAGWVYSILNGLAFIIAAFVI